MAANVHPTGNPGSINSAIENFRLAISASSEPLSSTLKYSLDPPNDHYNYRDVWMSMGDLYDPAYFLSTGKIRRIHTKWSVDGNSKNVLMYDANLMEEFFRASPKIGQGLLKAERGDWKASERGLLKAGIRDVIEKYPKLLCERELQEFQRFWMQNPDYTGILKGYGNIAVGRDEIRFVGLTPFPPDCYYGDWKLPVSSLRLMNFLEKFLGLLAQWCMCRYSYDNLGWTFSAAPQPLTPTMQVSREEEAAEVAAGDFPVETPRPEDIAKQEKQRSKKAELLEKKRAAANRRYVSRLIKQGLLDPEDADES